MVDRTDRILDFVQRHNLDCNIPLPARFHYEESALICLDAVLSIRQIDSHTEFVEPRMSRFRQHWPRVRSLPDLRWLIERRGRGRFAAIWNYRYPVWIPEQLVDWFLNYQREHDIDDDLEAMRHWAQQPVSQKFIDAVDGIGFPMAQYIRMLAGADTVMPNDTIRMAVGAALGRPGLCGEKEAVEILEAAACRLGVEARKLDTAIREAPISYAQTLSESGEWLVTHESVRR